MTERNTRMRKHHTLEKKIDIIRFKEQGHSISQAARKFRISHSADCEFYDGRERNSRNVLCWYAAT